MHTRARQIALEGRSTARELLLSGNAPVDRAGRPAESLLSVPEVRSTGRSTAAPTVRFLTVVGRPGGRPTALSGP